MGKIQLFCIPYAGGSSNIYQEWGNKLGLDVEVIPLEYKGHSGRFTEECYKNVEEVTDDFYEMIRQKVNGDFAIYGHSFGSIVAFETAYKLNEKAGLVPKNLILSGLRPPHLLYKDKKYSHLSIDEFMEQIYLLGQIPKEVMEDKEFYDFFKEIIYGDFKLYEAYVHDENLGKLHNAMTIFTGKADEEAPKSDMLEWKQYTDGQFNFYECEGDHFFAFSDNNEFFQLLKEQLEG